MSVLPNTYIGIMTGTSLDGVDAVLADVCADRIQVLASCALNYPPSLRQQMLSLQSGSDHQGVDELHRSQCAAIDLANLYAQAVAELLSIAGIKATDVVAIGAHGQTVRHMPNAATHGYTVQLLNAAVLAEATQIKVVSDFRSRDVAAGGQGAPLVPAFHATLCAQQPLPLAVCNIGGFANLTLLHADGTVQGLDTGPGNVLMDSWIQFNQGLPYDVGGAWAGSAQADAKLLQQLLQHPYFSQPLPKSTGRETFHLAWLQQQLAHHTLPPAQVQATLSQLTAHSIAGALKHYIPTCKAVYVCGGGAYNATLMQHLQTSLACPVSTTDTLGVPAQQVEALAFAWLARQTIHGLPANVPAVTGAKGLRVLGAVYAA